MHIYRLKVARLGTGHGFDEYLASWTGEAVWRLQ